MKTLIALLSLLACIANTSLLAQGGPPAWAGKAQGAPTATQTAGEDLAALERFLTLSDQQLDHLLQAITKVRAMSQEQRQAMKKQLLEYRSLPPEQREQVRKGWGWQSEQDRTDWPLMMHAKSEAERAWLQSEIQALAPEKRASRKHQILEDWRKAKTQ